MPMELALLPMIESSYNPSGVFTTPTRWALWQFIPVDRAQLQPAPNQLV